jgi:methyl-accepting chemotaxis protein
MPRVTDLKIWIRLVGAIWLMLVIAWNGLIFWESSVNRQTAIDQAKQFSLSMHEATLAGLTAMMVTKNMSKREIFLDQVKQLSVIRDLKVAPGEAVTSTYLPDHPKDNVSLDTNEEQVLKTGNEYVSIQSDEKGEYLHVVRPARNMQNYLGKNCTKCHEAPEKAVLGIVSMKISLNHVNEAVTTQRTKSLLAATLLSIPLLIFIYIFIRNVVTKPLEKMTAGLSDIAHGEGDLTRRLEVRSQDEIGQASSVFNEMMAKFSALVRHVGESAAEVSGAARELSAGAGQVADRSHRQKDTSMAASGSVDKMVSSIGSIAQSTEEVHVQSRESLLRSEEGNRSLSQLIGEVSAVESTVNQIAGSVKEFVDSTRAIAGMTQQVKDIANQTNLLALNAAIEAARAGEQGRGFAVVADEVRKLAEKSASSASEIDAITRTLSGQSDDVQLSVQSGLTHLESSRRSMDTVASVLAEASGSVTQVGEGLDTIANATDEQRRVSQEVAASIESIVDMARENDEAIERTAAAARRLEDLASNLQGIVGRFKT